MPLRKLSAALVTIWLATSCKPTGQNTWIDSWDYDNGGSGQFTESKRDWPVNILFIGSANFSRVSSALQAAGGGEGSGSNMYSRMQDRGALRTDASGGEKDRGSWQCTWLNYDWRHARYYANPSHGYNSTTSFGQLVFATSHYDFREHCGNAEFGWSEDAEFIWAVNLHCRGYQVEYSAEPMPGTRGYRWVTNKHYLQSDGKATRVYIPSVRPTPRACSNQF